MKQPVSCPQSNSSPASPNVSADADRSAVSPRLCALLGSLVFGAGCASIPRDQQMMPPPKMGEAVVAPVLHAQPTANQQVRLDLEQAEKSKDPNASVAKRLDEAVGRKDNQYIQALMSELSSHSRCDRYVGALRHLANNHPTSRAYVLHQIGEERTARFGNKAPDLLYWYAEQRPQQAAALAAVIGSPTRSAILGIQEQAGFPDVAKQMNAIAQSAKRP